MMIELPGMWDESDYIGGETDMREGPILIMTQDPVERFDVRRALWALGFVPRAEFDSGVLLPVISPDAFKEALGRYGYALRWVTPHRAEVTKREERRIEKT